MPDDTEPTAEVATPARRMPELGRGTCIGRYVVLDRIGAGGMGVVYRAYDPDLDRRVALKLVRDLHDDATTRLVREAQALARVSHPNIVAVHDVGTFAGTVFIAMELVEGPTLSQWHRTHRPGWRATLERLLDAARGLAVAHAAGLIHRDFKPNNAIVGPDGRVRVLDFGLARIAAPESGEDPITPGSGPMTSPSPIAALAASGEASVGVATASTAIEIPPDGALARAARVDLDGPTEPDDAAGLPRVLASRVIGTPVYMAPEQRRRGVIDSRADQFAFAVTAWELLHGERPFDGADARAYAESADAGRLRPPPAGTDVPAWVRRVLTRALRPSPGDRYRSMDDLIQALSADPAARGRRIALGALVIAAVAAGAVVVLQRPGAAPPPCEGSARRLVGVWDEAAAARLDAAFAATGAPFAADVAARVRAALNDRAAAWVTMHREACLATHAGDQSEALLDLRMGCLDRRRAELAAVVAELSGAPDVARVEAAVAAVDRLPDVAACADRDALTTVVPPPADPAARARIEEIRRELTAVDALLWTGQWAAGRDRAERAEADAVALGWAPLVAEASYARGQLERQAGRLDAAEAALAAAARAAARAHLDDLAAEALTELVAVIGHEQGRPVEGLALAVAAEVALARADAPPRAVAGLHEARALALFGKGDLAGALAEAERALAIREALPGAQASVADILNTIAIIASARGDHPGSEAAHRRVLALREELYGAAHPLVADSIDNLAVTLHHQGKRDEARALYERALALRTAALGGGHRDVGTSHNNLGSLLLDLGDRRAATHHLERALAIYEATLGADHVDLAIPLSNLGELATARGEPDRAVAYCERALALDEAASGADDPDLAYDLVCLGEAHLARGDHAAARAALDRALALRESAEGDAGELARTRLALAKALWHLGDRPRARALARAARDGFAAAGSAWSTQLADAEAWLRAPR